MIVHLEMDYTVRFSSAEFRIVSMALAGKISSKEDTREALRLNEKLCDLRVRELAVASEVASGAHQKAVALRDAVEGAAVLKDQEGQ